VTTSPIPIAHDIARERVAKAGRVKPAKAGAVKK
jgi:hypothetical protein